MAEEQEIRRSPGDSQARLLATTTRTTAQLGALSPRWLVVVHLIGLALLGGLIILVDLRLLGFGARSQTAGELAVALRGWTVAALVITIASGGLLFLSEALHCYENPPFWLKMGSLAAAVLFTFTVRQRVARRSSHVVTWRERTAAAVSLTLWFAVGLMGRGIGLW
jgi:hypothetical protein